MNCIGVYIHVPFCTVKCPYCDFYSLSNYREISDRYTDSLLEHFVYGEQSDCKADTLYVGGGTPILLGIENLRRVTEVAFDRFGLSRESEVTIEVNPCTVDQDQLYALYRMGFNRLSIGLQSANQCELDFLGRRHTAKEAAQTVRWAQKAGFENISLDLMLGLQGQTQESLIRSVDFCAELKVQHISAYLLKIEPDTPFYHMNPQLPDEDEQASLYLTVVRALEAHGYPQYEISNFGKPSRHNMKYWNCEPYLAFGPSAHGFIGNQRYAYPRDLTLFMDSSKHPQSILTYEPGGELEEYLMVRLRLVEVIDFVQTKARYPSFDKQKILTTAKRLKQLVEINPERIRLTAEGFLLSNQVIGALIE